jgi:hypothetical protein
VTNPRCPILSRSDHDSTPQGSERCAHHSGLPPAFQPGRVALPLPRARASNCCRGEMIVVTISPECTCPGSQDLTPSTTVRAGIHLSLSSRRIAVIPTQEGSRSAAAIVQSAIKARPRTAQQVRRMRSRRHRARSRPCPRSRPACLRTMRRDPRFLTLGTALSLLPGEPGTPCLHPRRQTPPPPSP